MIPNPSLHWSEILAAYADGELEGRDDLALLKQRVEDWLKRHPEAQAELAEYRRLRQLWQETTPAEPADQAWRQVLAGVGRGAGAAAATAATGRPWKRALALAAAAASIAALALTLPRTPPSTPPPKPDVAVAQTPAEDEEVFAVARMDEVVVLSVEGADTPTLVVGSLPLQGSMELAAPGEVRVTSMQPDAGDRMVPVLRSDGRPMIWARLDSE